ncbi:MAG: hypothetical protein COA68_02375 [Oceanobacter sp.]|nr:MAG: hypothetical protein COA68_02375 [Oceanobacter sp.]
MKIAWILMVALPANLVLVNAVFATPSLSTSNTEASQHADSINEHNEPVNDEPINDEPIKNEALEHGSMIEVIAMAQRKSTLPLIRYCIEQQPDLKEQLKVSFLGYGAKVDEALTPLIKEYRNDPDAQRPTDDLKAIEKKLMDQVNMKISKLTIADSAHYCRWMMTQLDAIEVEQFRAQIREGYELMKKFPRN